MQILSRTLTTIAFRLAAAGKLTYNVHVIFRIKLPLKAVTANKAITNSFRNALPEASRLLTGFPTYSPQISNGFSFRGQINFPAS